MASLGDSDAALKQYDKAISINPNFYQAHYNAGCVFMSKNDLHAAIESFKKVITLDPHSYKAYYNVGLAQLKSRQFKEALENVRKVITLNGNFADGHILMGNILRELMHIKSAIIH